MSYQKEWDIDQEFSGKTVQTFLREEALFSRQLLKNVKAGGLILINNEEVPVSTMLSTADRLTVVFPEEVRSKVLIPEPIPLQIVYEDEDVLVLDKPAGLAVSPTADYRSGTLANGIVYDYDQKGYDYTVHIVTRLDRDTSGLLLVAKQQYSHGKLAVVGDIKRDYTALVEGNLSPSSGMITAPIGRKAGSIIEREITPEGKEAVTEYEVAEMFPSASLVHMRLHTGRTHQIRVHMSSIGCPLVGDTLYGASSSDEVKGHALHCHRLAFNHPSLGEHLSFQSRPPQTWLKPEK
ncbi:RluA family pseudouridine synthase [Halobacillus naozhouensis]|uniref:Pseudouridine synthase n=1 Tax=Halobacillus naozhouensis TaxID=554880 RepID=A0ABY8J111_9BACI|nr:RluA family pseudouridine synthase [Halobacillus naozhouensis]WFT76183.1 RluA family pseudouridine synthase [Halobacillus naozhouensis]